MRKQSDYEKKCVKRINEIQEERSKLDRKFHYWHSRLKKEIEKSLCHVSKMTIKNADWEEILALELPESQIKFKKYNELMHELGFWPGEYYPETMQRCIKIIIRRKTANECINKTIESLKIVLPFIKPIKCKNGRKYKVIAVFCDYEFGIPQLLIKNDGKARIIETRYSRNEFKTEWLTLKEALLYIDLNHSYKD